MKKEKAEARKAKQVERKNAKDQKAKKKQEKKQSKKDTKINQTKGGRTSKKKNEERVAKEKKTKRGKVAEQTHVEEESPDPIAAGCLAEDAVAEDAVAPAPSTDYVPEKICAVKSKKMQRLRKMGSGWKGGMNNSIIELVEGVGGEKTTAEIGGDEKKTKKADRKKVDRKTKKTKASKGHTPNKTKKKKKKGSEEKTLKKSPAKKGKGKGSAKAQSQPKKPRSNKRAADAKPQTRSRRAKKEYPVHEPARAIALATLKECSESQCTHPSFVFPEFSDVFFSPYWTRNAVGVKVDRTYVKEVKKGKGKAQTAQVAYFGGPKCSKLALLLHPIVSCVNLNGHQKVTSGKAPSYHYRRGCG